MKCKHESRESSGGGVSRETHASQRGQELLKTEADESTTLKPLPENGEASADCEVRAVVNCRVFELAIAL
jgi:hypothetical protein